MRLLHQSDRPSSTAQWTTLGRALELHHPEPIVVDRFAPLFLSGASRLVQRGLLGTGAAFRRAEQLEIAGLATSGLCRHRFIDEHLLAALPDVDQVVILGAGYDSRAYRFAPQILPRPVFEVDLPPLSRRKAAIVAANRARFGSPRVRRVEIDFRTQSLAGRLDATGFVAGAPTCVIWEGVSMYLTHDAVAATLATLADLCGPRSAIAMDFWQQVPGPGGILRVAVEQGMRLLGEPVTFPQPAASVGRLLDDAGFQLVDLAEADVMTTRYATGGRVCDPGMYVVAACLPTGR